MTAVLLQATILISRILSRPQNSHLGENRIRTGGMNNRRTKTIPGTKVEPVEPVDKAVMVVEMVDSISTIGSEK